MLSSLSSMSPSAPLMLFVNTTGVPGVPPVVDVAPMTGILTIESIAVLATNIASPALLNSIPFAPNGGTLWGGLLLLNGKRRGSVTQADASPHSFPPSFGDQRQMMPSN